MKTLSKVLSTAIMQALEDLEAIKNNDNYSIDFSDWHHPTPLNSQFGSEGTRCSVCFAGSVMANRLKADETKREVPSNFNEHSRMLKALDEIRRGRVQLALITINIDYNPKIKDNMPVDQRNYKQFVIDVTAIANMLKEHDL